LIISIPFGVLSAINKVVDYITRPIMDLMQTMPPWVYLVPAVILFSLGKTPAVMATAIFSIPPALRLTNLGIRQVSAETVEVGKAFGGSRLQVLTKIQIPMALPTIMMGVNQCIMLSLSMAVLAGLIGAGGLGSEIVRALSRMNIGLGVRSGLCIVVLAIILDRILQGIVHLTSKQGDKVVAETTI
jgi:glycine betaine/proline transport system permease protein